MIQKKPYVRKSFLDMVGNTPLVQFKHSKNNKSKIFIKLEGFNPTGSIKDRTAVSLLKKAKIKNKTIIDSSSGSFACSLAYFGFILKKKVQVVCSSKLTKDKEDFIKHYNAKIRKIGNFTIEGNEYCRKLKKKFPNKYIFLDQLHNKNNPLIHFQTTAKEIKNHLKTVNAIVISLGSGGTALGISKYFKNSKTKIVLVESASKTKLPGVGSFDDGDYETPFIKEIKLKKLFNYIYKVHINEIKPSYLELKKQGFFCGPQTAALLKATKTLIDKKKITGNIVLISGDSGWKNFEDLRNKFND
jgi:[CysO sulfur-carrier protein]-thiocarboxylate-dependent cysteine synthase